MAKKPEGAGDVGLAEDLMAEGDEPPPDALRFDAEGNLLEAEGGAFVRLSRAKRGTPEA